MKRKWQLIIALALALVVTGGLYASSYLTATATMDVTVAGEAIATAAPSATQPDWNSILTPPEDPPLMGEVPSGDLFDITPNSLYTGDLAVKIFLTNTGDLAKAYDYLNMKLYLDGSVEAGETPNYQLLTLQNGETTFNIQDIAGIEGTWTQTSQSDFQGGTLNQVDAATSPGDVILDTFTDNVIDSFNDESMIFSKTNLVVDGGQVKLTAGGAGSTETLRPNADGDETEVSEQEPATGAHWDKVDDVTSDDDTTYIATNSYLWEEDLYNIPNHSAGSGSINYVKVYAVAKSMQDPAAENIYVQIKTNGLEDDGTAYMTTQNYTTFSHQWDTNPQTGQPWTWDEIDALQIGVGLLRPAGIGGPGTRYTRCTQVYAEVNYTAYDSPGTLTSVNLLSGETVVSIDSFGYNASAIPSGTGLKVQFSQDSSTWYDSSGNPGQWDTLSEGSHSIDLSGLGWSGANFYYKMEFTSDGTDTPVLDEISVNFSTYYASGDLTSSTYDSGHDADWGTISFTIDEPSATNIQFQIRTAATEGGLSAATWYGPTGTGDYYTTSGTNINSVHDGDRWIQYKAYFSGPGGDTPTLSDVSITYSAEAVSFTVEVTGGSYCLVSTDTSEWEAGWTVTPEFYCLIMQR
ncbi:hypothetical protein ES708_09274 [subsurface metagenome]